MASKEMKKCKSCDKQVFQMELVKAERSFWHRGCFKCHECGKQLRMDTYQSHEGVLYCKPHFRALFAPKPVKEATENVTPVRKYEVIVRENEPVALPPDVVRSSDKPSLGLEDLQALNLRSRYQMFEAGGRGVADSELRGEGRGEASDGEEEEEEGGGGGNFTERLGVREMRDIRRKFEEGGAGREERREERKAEIQNIRQRLFMGKQARIKEMYQQAVADSEQAGGGGAEPRDVGVCQETAGIRERFERGEAFRGSGEGRAGREGEDVGELVQHGLARHSRSIFQEMDATQATQKPNSELQRSPSQIAATRPPPAEIVRSDSQSDSVQVETSEISSRFRFFETYQPSGPSRRTFRMTPPREGVVRMPSPERPEYAEWPKAADLDAEGRNTAARMLNIFRQMELEEEEPRPPKSATPPPPAENGHEPKARQLRSKFENWDFDGVERTQSAVKLFEESGEESQVESTKSLSAKFESMREASSVFRPRQNIKVNRFV